MQLFPLCHLYLPSSFTTRTKWTGLGTVFCKSPSKTGRAVLAWIRDVIQITTQSLKYLANKTEPAVTEWVWKAGTGFLQRHSLFEMPLGKQNNKTHQNMHKNPTASYPESLTGVTEHFQECKRIILIYSSKCIYKWLDYYLNCADCKSSAITCPHNHTFDMSSEALEFIFHCHKHKQITYLGAVFWLTSHWKVTPLSLYSIQGLLTTLSN